MTRNSHYNSYSWILKGVDCVNLSLSSDTIGNHHWTFTDDINCNEGKTVETSVSLALCPPSDFNCDDGQCVDLFGKCNGFNNCQDGSDEMYCYTVQLPATYNKQLSPQTSDDLTKVNVSFEVTDMLDIDEKTGKVRVKFLLATAWNDFRLEFLDLWLVTEKNLLSREETEKIWYPHIEFDNAELAHFDYDKKEQIYIITGQTRDSFNYTPTSALMKAEVYQGSLNTLYWKALIRWLYVY
jgi:hypothetical protein